MKKIILLSIFVVVILTLTSCLPGNLAVDDKPAGFLWGIWHGWIAPLSLIISLFNDKVNMYEVHNSGFFYNLGFYMAIIGGFGGITLSRKKKKDD